MPSRSCGKWSCPGRFSSQTFPQGGNWEPGPPVCLCNPDASKSAQSHGQSSVQEPSTRSGTCVRCVWVISHSETQPPQGSRSAAPPLRTVPVPFRPFRSSRSARSGDRCGAVLGSEAVWRNPGSCWAGAGATKGLPHPSASRRAAQTVNNGVVIAGSGSRIARLIANKRFIWSGYVSRCTPEHQQRRKSRRYK